MGDVVEIYRRTKDFKRAVRESGLPALEAHMELMESGVVEFEDDINYMRTDSKMGLEAEKLFQELVPKAVNANKVIRKNNPVYDFLYGDLKIDVKYSSLHFAKEGSRRLTPFYGFRSKGRPDIFVVFCERDYNKGLSFPYVLIIPASFVAISRFGYSKSFIKMGDFFKNFVIYTKNLNKTIERFEMVKRYEKRSGKK